MIIPNFGATMINNLLENYEQNSWYYVPKDKAYKYLKHVTKQDFGYDAEAWAKWFAEEERPYRYFGSMEG